MFLGFGYSLTKPVVTIPIKKALLATSKRRSRVWQSRSDVLATSCFKRRYFSQFLNFFVLPLLTPLLQNVECAPRLRQPPETVTETSRAVEFNALKTEHLASFWVAINTTGSWSDCLKIDLKFSNKMVDFIRVLSRIRTSLEMTHRKRLRVDSNAL